MLDTEYESFLDRKAVVAPPSGFEPVRLPKIMKPFQRDITTWACRRGRAAIFAGTGLGKTIMELAWGQQVVRRTKGQILLFTPLAVAQQTVNEAAKFGIKGVAYAADQSSANTPIVVTNYDRRDKFDISKFAGIILDESGIIKDHDSKTRRDLTEACRSTPYLLCGSATPAPNDWTELGQHAEFLGVMLAKEMLAMFFVHDGAVRADTNGEEWRLKGHAQEDFWRWVASWAVMIRHPRELGYEEPGYDLPPLNIHQITVQLENTFANGELFPTQALTLKERVGARRDTIADRVRAAADIVASKPNEPWLVWCNLNAEADALTAAIPDAINVQGGDKPDVKTRHLLGFTAGQPRVIVSKPSIAGRGMNYQHCCNQVFVGLNDSFEQLFQAVRRCWRFGQSRDVNVYMVASEIEGAVVKNLQDKERKYEAMAEAMAAHMTDLCKAQVRGGRVSTSTYDPKLRMELPSWLQ